MLIFFDDTIFWKREFTLFFFFTDRSWRIKLNSVTYDILRGCSHFLNSIRFAMFRTFYQYPFVRYIAILDHILNDSFLMSYILYMFFPCTGLESIIIKSICIFVLSLFYNTNVPIQIRVVLRHCLKSAAIFHQAVPQNKPGRCIMILISPLNVNSLKLKKIDDEFKNSDLELSLEIMTVVICNLIMFIYRENKMKTTLSFS